MPREDRRNTVLATERRRASPIAIPVLPMNLNPKDTLIASKSRATPREIHFTPRTASNETNPLRGNATKQMSENRWRSLVRLSQPNPERMSTQLLQAIGIT
jgi:hypothetical protein